MTRAMPSELYIWWNPNCGDDDGDFTGSEVRIYFTAGNWIPFSRATWTQPAEGGFFEDIRFVRAENDPDGVPSLPLTQAEIGAAALYLESEAGNDAAQEVAIRELRNV